MMKKKIFCSFFAVGILLFAGCSNENGEMLDEQPEVLPDGRVEVRFAAGNTGG